MKDTIYKLPQPFIHKIQKIHPQTFPRVCETFLHRKVPAFRANYLKTDLLELRKRLVREKVKCQELTWPKGSFILKSDLRALQKTPVYTEGVIYVQNVSSMIPPVLLDVAQDEKILDMCAAPGNKSAQIAVLMKNQGTIIANDINFGRMKAVRQAQERLGLVNLTTTVYDGANYPKAAGLFDKILVDAPCSCEGTIRKDPVVGDRIGPDVSLKKSAGQKALLRKAVQLCKPGGLIVYSTCTFAPEENEMVVDDILQTFGPDTVRLLPARLPRFNAAPGLTGWQNRQFDSTLRHTMRVWPHQNDTGGFFVALIQKTNSASPRPAPLPPETPLPPPEPALTALLTERFGLEPVRLKSYRLFQPHKKRAYIVAQNHQPPVAPPPDAIGMVFMKTKIKFPKLSTAAALLLNNFITRNFIELTAGQAEDYHHRREVRLTAEQSRACTGLGYVLVRYQGAALGIGFFHPADNGGGILNSLFPKGWSPAR